MERVDAMRCLCDERMASGSSRLTALALRMCQRAPGGRSLALSLPLSPSTPTPLFRATAKKGPGGRGEEGVTRVRRRGFDGRCGGRPRVQKRTVNEVQERMKKLHWLRMKRSEDPDSPQETAGRPSGMRRWPTDKPAAGFFF